MGKRGGGGRGWRVKAMVTVEVDGARDGARTALAMALTC